MASLGQQVALAEPEIQYSCRLATGKPVHDKPADIKLAKDIPGVFPEPMVVSSQLDHQQTFIILHGRGSTAQIFSPPLLETTTASGEKLQTAFPHAKIIFLTASRSRAIIYKRSYTHQWFDQWHMEVPHKRQDLMREGLRKSCEYIHGMLEREISIIGRENVVLWGLSQGCATSLTSLLTWQGEPFAAMVGMCGYLPFANHIEEITRGNKSDSEGDDVFAQAGDDDPFAHSGDEVDDDYFTKSGCSSSKKDRAMEAVMFLREEIDMDSGKNGMVFRSVPVLLGHGKEDDNVPIEHGREAERCLQLMGADVKMVEYEGLGHWYSEEMLGDIFDFLRGKLG